MRPPNVCLSRRKPHLAFCTLFAIAATQALSQTSSSQEAELHYKVARVALNNNDLNAAVDELSKAVDLAPENAVIQYYLAVALKQQRPKDGLEHLHLAVKLGLVGLSAAEKARVNNLVAELTYAARLQPLLDLIGSWSEDDTTNETSRTCNSTVTRRRRMRVPTQEVHGGLLDVEFSFSQHASVPAPCTFSATGTNLDIYEVKRKGTVSRSGDQMKLQLEKGQCTGDCLEADVNGFSGLLENASRDEVTLRSDDGDRKLLVSETPSAKYLSRKQADSKAADDALAAARNKTLRLFSGKWSFTSTPDVHSWGRSGCKGERQRGENLDFETIAAEYTEARGVDDTWYKEDITQDPRATCHLAHDQDQIEYHQVGQAVVSCQAADSCQFSITYEPCIGEFCEEKMASPGQVNCKVVLSEMSAESFTLRCGETWSAVFQRP